MQSAIRKRPEEIEAIIARARDECRPYFLMMEQMLEHSTLTAIMGNDGKIAIKYSCESDENFIQLKQIVKDICEKSQLELNN